MDKTLGTTCKAVGATILIGIAVLLACVFDESSRTSYPARPARPARR